MSVPRAFTAKALASQGTVYNERGTVTKLSTDRSITRGKVFIVTRRKKIARGTWKRAEQGEKKASWTWRGPRNLERRVEMER